MISRRVLRLVVTLAAAWLTAAGGLQAQLAALTRPSQAAQAKSQEELDSYLDIVTATEPRRVVGLVDAFAHEFSQSELLSSAYQAQLRAYEQLDDIEGTLLAGRRSLAGSPDNLDTLLNLASAIANRASSSPDRDRLLSEARTYAQRVLAGIDRIRIPLKLPLDKWHVQKQRMQSEAHDVLGVIALQRDQLTEALTELGTALTLAPTPQGVQFLRLGLAQASAGKKKEAEGNLRRAAELGPAAVSTLASGELNKLKRSAQ